MKKSWILRILLAGALLSAFLALPAAHAQDTPRRIEITAKRFSFTPGEITLKKGEPVILVLKSVDTTHGMRIRELNLDVKIKPGNVEEVKFTPDKTGDFVGHCSVFCGSGHGTMTIKVHVVS